MPRGFSEGAKALLATRTELAVLAVPALAADALPDYGIAELDFHRIEGGLLVETRDRLDIDHAQLHVVTQRRPTLEELTDLMFAWRAVRHITSLAVVVAKGATLVGVGAGQSSRLTATEIALHRAADRAPRSVLASDAYFPFGDAIALAAERGVTAIIQPGGSVRDEMAIEIECVCCCRRFGSGHVPARLSTVTYCYVCLTALMAAPSWASPAAPDPVLDWMQITNDTVLAAGTTPLFTGRQVAMVSAAVFDAVNGIDRSYQSLFVKTRAPRQASERAAAIEAAYAILIRLYPTQVTLLTDRRDASIAAISSRCRSGTRSIDSKRDDLGTGRRGQHLGPARV